MYQKALHLVHQAVKGMYTYIHTQMHVHTITGRIFLKSEKCFHLWGMGGKYILNIILDDLTEVQ